MNRWMSDCNEIFLFDINNVSLVKALVTKAGTFKIIFLKSLLVNLNLV